MTWTLQLAETSSINCSLHSHCCQQAPQAMSASKGPSYTKDNNSRSCCAAALKLLPPACLQASANEQEARQYPHDTFVHHAVVAQEVKTLAA
jgi:hypothetical protein